MSLPHDVYASLLTMRTQIRRLLRWSAEQAKAAGLIPMQHQLLLAIRGHADPDGLTIGEAADHLLIRHHSVGRIGATGRRRLNNVRGRASALRL